MKKKNSLTNRLLRKNYRFTTSETYYITCPSYTQNIKFKTFYIFRGKEKLLVMNAKLYTTVIKTNQA